MKHTYTNEQLIEAVKTSFSIRQVLSKLGLKEAGGNYSTVTKKIQLLNINISHFKGRGWNKGKNFGPKRPLEDYLSNTHSIQSFKLKKRLIREKILPHQCNCCKLKEWINKPIPLEIHHKDGNSSNNNLTNLALLCPNCHAQTENYRAKNRKSAEGGTRTRMGITPDSV